MGREIPHEQFQVIDNKDDTEAALQALGEELWRREVYGAPAERGVLPALWRLYQIAVQEAVVQTRRI